jgi:hypothetical protein
MQEREGNTDQYELTKTHAFSQSNAGMRGMHHSRKIPLSLFSTTKLCHSSPVAQCHQTTILHQSLLSMFSTPKECYSSVAPSQTVLRQSLTTPNQTHTTTPPLPTQQPHTNTPLSSQQPNSIFRQKQHPKQSTQQQQPRDKPTQQPHQSDSKNILYIKEHLLFKLN